MYHLSKESFISTSDELIWPGETVLARQPWKEIRFDWLWVARLEGGRTYVIVQVVVWSFELEEIVSETIGTNTYGSTRIRRSTNLRVFIIFIYMEPYHVTRYHERVSLSLVRKYKRSYESGASAMFGVRGTCCNDAINVNVRSYLQSRYSDIVPPTSTRETLRMY